MKSLPCQEQTKSAARDAGQKANHQELVEMGIESSFNGGDEIHTKDGRVWIFSGKNEWITRTPIKVGALGSGKIHYCAKCGFGVFSCQHDAPQKTIKLGHFEGFKDDATLEAWVSHFNFAGDND